MKNILFIAFVCIFAISCQREYLYLNEIPNILGTNIGECIETYQASSNAIGEWYYCETYSFEEKDSISPRHNTLYTDDASWVRHDWTKLPIDSAYLKVCNVIFNYCGTSKTEMLSREMEKINALGCGYYSFCVKPSFDDPRYIIFCMLDTTETRLYVVDAHL